MARMTREGLFYFHMILFTFGAIIFIVLKNFDFEDYKNSPILTDTQTVFIYLLFVIGLIILLLYLARGYSIKTPQWSTRGAVALIFVFLGLAFILEAFLHDQIMDQTEEFGGLECLMIIFGSMIIIAGSFSYNALKFRDDRQDRLFVRAIRDEIEKAREIAAVTRRQRRTRRPPAPSTEMAPITIPEPTDKLVMAEAPADDVIGKTLVKCVRCKRMLKLSSDKRPITIKCPYCEAIGVIKE
jgi:DNA-directed RNA polymerase subunit RPC12/RpoP